MRSGPGPEKERVPRRKANSAKHAKGKAARKDGKPRRALSAYNFFVREERARLLKETSDSGASRDQKFDPNVAFASTGRLVAERWKKVTDTERQRYQTMADEDMVRYQAAVQTHMLREIGMEMDGSAPISSSSTDVTEASTAPSSDRHAPSASEGSTSSPQPSPVLNAQWLTASRALNWEPIQSSYSQPRLPDYWPYQLIDRSIQPSIFGYHFADHLADVSGADHHSQMWEISQQFLQQRARSIVNLNTHIFQHEAGYETRLSELPQADPDLVRTILQAEASGRLSLLLRNHFFGLPTQAYSHQDGTPTINFTMP